jgi:hypothetical protein
MRIQEFITELFDPKTALPLKWDEQFAASHNEVHVEAMDEEGRELYISFVPVGFRSTVIEITFTREGSYDITGQGDAARVLATVAKAIDIYLRKYSPKYVVFSSKEGSRTGVYSAMVRRLLKGYTQVPPDQFPPGLEEWGGSTQGGTPFVFKRI